MTEAEIDAYIDRFLVFEQVCKRRGLRVYPDKEEYVAMFSQEDVLSLWNTYCLIQNKGADK